MTKCFLIQPTGEALRFLRRYANGPCPLMPGEHGYHEAATFLDRAPIVAAVEYLPSDDPRWPAACACGAPFPAPTAITRPLFSLHLYRRADGQPGEYVLHGRPYPPAVTAPVGAMWCSDWMPASMKGADGHSITVRCPGDHDWAVDGRASNCTETCVHCGHEYHEHNYPSGGHRAFDCDGYEPRDSGAHRCWVRHGTAPNVTVDKNGLTCRAGAGSIQVSGWHGFLRNGELVE